MRRILLLLAAAPLWAQPFLPKVAATLPMPNCRIKLSMVVTSPGSITPPRGTTGTLELATDNRFRFRAPELLAVSDGKLLWQWNASTNQVVMRSPSQVQQLGLPLEILQAALAGSETKASRETVDGKAVQRLELDVSKPPLSKFIRATLWAKESGLSPVRLEVEEDGGNTTTWNLLAISKWKPADTDFAFAPPKGAEVVDLR